MSIWTYVSRSVNLEVEDQQVETLKSKSFDFEKTEQMIESENLAKTIILTQLI